MDAVAPEPPEPLDPPAVALAARAPAAVRWGLPLLGFLVPLAVALGDHVFRDEFYYLACADHLAWGYVDHPPASIAVLWGVRAVLGDGLLALRLVPALALAGTVFLTGDLARRLGGDLWAQALAMTAVLATPAYLALTSFYSMNALDLLVWAAAFRLFASLVLDDAPRLWLPLGLLLGLGLLNKLSVLWLGAGLLVSLFACHARRHLLTPWPWLGAALAGVLFLPHVLWQAHHGWPTAEFIENATRAKMVRLTPLEFLASQVLPMNPVLLPLWLGGGVGLLTSRSLRRAAPLAMVWIVVATLLALNGASRPTYLAPAYLPLLAAGAVLASRPLARARTWVRALPIAGVATAGIVAAPLALPILPVDAYVAYSRTLGVRPGTSERKAVGLLPQHLADRQGWETWVASVGEAFRRLPPDLRAGAVVFTGNYGEAGAIAYYGEAFGLPPAVSGHNSYWMWGPGGWDGDAVLFVGRLDTRTRLLFRTVRRVGRTRCGLCMPYERGVPIYLLAGLKIPVERAWAGTRHYE